MTWARNGRAGFRRRRISISGGVCHPVVMRVHISLDDEIVRALDESVGQRRRSAFIAAAVMRALDEERRWKDIEQTIGALSDADHAWDADAAAWVREQRIGDSRRLG